MKEVSVWNTLPSISFGEGKLQELLRLPEEEKKQCWMRKVESGRSPNVGNMSRNFYHLKRGQSLKTLEDVAQGVGERAYDLNALTIRSKGMDHFFFINDDLITGDTGIPYLL